MKTFLRTFSRSQVSSLLATAADYGLLFFCTEVLHIWYVASTALGALIGAVTNFLLNRYWSFHATQSKMGDQAQRYVSVSAASLMLNTAGVYLMTEYFHVYYAISVILVSLSIGFFINYPLFRWYVYKE